MNTKRKRKRMGRPPLPAGMVKSVRLCIRTTPAEYKRLRAEARRQGTTVAELLMLPWRKEA